MGKYEAPELTFLPDNGQDIIVMSTDNDFIGTGREKK